jgi:hypothetical protein
MDDEETMIPMKDVIPNPTGIEMSWDQTASFGLRAKRAKSGSFYNRILEVFDLRETRDYIPQ